MFRLMLVCFETGSCLCSPHCINLHSRSSCLWLPDVCWDCRHELPWEPLCCVLCCVLSTSPTSSEWKLLPFTFGVRQVEQTWSSNRYLWTGCHVVLRNLTSAPPSLLALLFFFLFETDWTLYTQKQQLLALALCCKRARTGQQYSGI